jgi:hypothetical protein
MDMLMFYYLQAPQEPDPWSNVRDAVVEGSVAPHIDEFQKQYVGEEDCLFLNVYTPAVIQSFPVNYDVIEFKDFICATKYVFVLSCK